MIRVFADFNNADRHGRVRLNCNGTSDDLAALKAERSEGMRVELDDHDEFVVKGTVRWNGAEGWVAEVDWDQLGMGLKQRVEGIRDNVDLAADRA
jgi:hypothetical protein